MADLLVKLYDLPALAPVLDDMAVKGITVRHAMPYEKREVVDWVKMRIRPDWESECDVAFSHQPVSCMVATQDGKLIGFACHEVTARGYFGPTGVDEACRGQGVGRALLLASLHAMAELGYGYAIIGSAGPVDFYRKACGATVIEGSEPGLYRDRLKP